MPSAAFETAPSCSRMSRTAPCAGGGGPGRPPPKRPAAPPPPPPGGGMPLRVDGRPVAGLAALLVGGEHRVLDVEREQHLAPVGCRAGREESVADGASQ